MISSLCDTLGNLASGSCESFKPLQRSKAARYTQTTRGTGGGSGGGSVCVCVCGGGGGGRLVKRLFKK